MFGDPDQLRHGAHHAGQGRACANRDEQRPAARSKLSVPSELNMVSICRTLFRRFIISVDRRSRPNSRVAEQLP